MPTSEHSLAQSDIRQKTTQEEKQQLGLFGGKKNLLESFLFHLLIVSFIQRRVQPNTL